MSESPTAAVSVTAPSAKDGLFFLSILMNMKNKPEVDWTLVAAEAGFKNAKVAATRYGQIKKKIMPKNEMSGSVQDSPNRSLSSMVSIPGTPKTPSKSPPKRAGKEVQVESDVMSGVSEGRIKKSPAKPGSKARVLKTRSRETKDVEELNDTDVFESQPRFEEKTHQSSFVNEEFWIEDQC